MSATPPYFPLLIDGEWHDGESAQSRASKNPATGEDWAHFACATESEVEQAVVAARKALHGEWRDLSATERGKILHRLADLVEKNADHLGSIETRDSGKLAAETVPQVRYAADYYRYYAGIADKIEGATLPIDKPDIHVFTVREPIGVVAAIIPWNAPMFLTATKLGPALAAGCTVILKASEIAPCALLAFAELIKDSGLPAGVVSVITGDAERCAAPLASHPHIDRLAFTGGPDTARQIIRHTANNFAVTTLELGGKSPILIFEDAHLESAINGLIAGNYGASGQSCVAGSRAIVAASIKDEIIDRLRDKMSDIIIGDPQQPATHIGPLCTAGQITRIESALKTAQKQGAKIHFGGRRLPRPGNYFEPTLVECTDAGADILKTELFGPVLSIIPFADEAEALRLANDSPYGLGSGLFTESVTRALRVSKRLHTGICWINTYRSISPIAPFGGYNQSGYGREAGSESVLDYTRTKTVWINASEAPMSNPFTIR